MSRLPTPFRQAMGEGEIKRAVSAPGPWYVAPAIGHHGCKRVQRKVGGAIEILRSASGRYSVFKTEAAAERAAKLANSKATQGGAA